MKHGSLFSGIGGFDLASEWMGWENVFHCEWMEFPRKVLDYYWPNADSYIDICKTDFTKYANKIDILTGGFPCQPFSMAGKRKGTEDERYLWGEMLRAIQEIKPKFVIAENVFGITNIDGGLVFEQVCVDLENEGYEVQPFIIPAAAKNAPHRRDRCWFVAYSSSNGRSKNTKSKSRKNKENRKQSQCLHNSRNATDTNGFRYRGGYIEPRTNKFKEWKMDKNIEQYGDRVWCKVEGCSGDATNTERNGLEHGNKTTNIRSEKNKTRSKGGESSIDFKANGSQSNWEKFPTQSPICGGDDGLPTELDGITFSKWRAESIKGYGNAIVPQVAFEIFQVIEKINCNLSK